MPRDPADPATAAFLAIYPPVPDGNAAPPAAPPAAGGAAPAGVDPATAAGGAAPAGVDPATAAFLAQWPSQEAAAAAAAAAAKKKAEEDGRKNRDKRTTFECERCKIKFKGPSGLFYHNKKIHGHVAKKSKRGHANKGRQLSAEQREKMSAAHKGKKHSADTRATMKRSAEAAWGEGGKRRITYNARAKELEEEKKKKKAKKEENKDERKKKKKEKISKKKKKDSPAHPV
eukprot:g1285.t1